MFYLVLRVCVRCQCFILFFMFVSDASVVSCSSCLCQVPVFYLVLRVCDRCQCFILFFVFVPCASVLSCSSCL